MSEDEAGAPARTTWSGVDVVDLMRDGVEDRGADPRLAEVVALVDEATRPRPLAEVLAALCGSVSSILRAEVVSFYLREQSELRMAANVGFPAGAVSRVRLRVGEGITGHVAATLRPAAVVLAAEDQRYKPFPELREERFPVFMAVPMLVGHRAEGVVVLQRAASPFDDGEVVLAAALTPAFALALERAQAQRSETTGEGGSAARFEGAALAPGEAMGRVETLPTFEGLAAIERARVGDDASEGARMARLEEARGALEKELARARGIVQPRLPASWRGDFEVFALADADGAFRDALREVARGPSIVAGLRKLARDYAQVPFKKRGQDPRGWLRARSAEFEDRCLLLAARVVGERMPTTQGVLLLPDRLTTTMALACVAQRVAGVTVCNSTHAEALSIAVARIADLPVVGDVGGLFAWARRGDLVLIDGAKGVVRVAPSADQVAEFRDRRRDAPT